MPPVLSASSSRAYSVDPVGHGRLESASKGTSAPGQPSATLNQAGTRNNNFTGPLYAATPALLHQYGISPSQIRPTTAILTMRPGLAAEPRMQLVYGSFFNGQPGGSGCATALGLLIALGVLTMTVGLIRSETASDLRTLTAAGASGATRRTLTGATAGALALLGAVLGTGVACLAAIAWAHSTLGTTFGNVPTGDLVVILAGLPLTAAVGGWLLAGREPAAIARQPIE
jgi:hypothetical protein